MRYATIFLFALLPLSAQLQTRGAPDPDLKAELTKQGFEIARTENAQVISRGGISGSLSFSTIVYSSSTDIISVRVRFWAPEEVTDATLNSIQAGALLRTGSLQSRPDGLIEGTFQVPLGHGLTSERLAYDLGQWWGTLHSVKRLIEKSGGRLLNPGQEFTAPVPSGSRILESLQSQYIEAFLDTWKWRYKGPQGGPSFGPAPAYANIRGDLILISATAEPESNASKLRFTTEIKAPPDLDLEPWLERQRKSTGFALGRSREPNMVTVELTSTIGIGSTLGELKKALQDFSDKLKKLTSLD